MAKYGGLYSALHYRVDREQSDDDYSEMDDFIQQQFTDSNAEDSIVSVFMVPYAIYLGNQVGSGTPFNSQTMSFARPTTIDGYTPRNKKLLTFPYCYLVLDVINDSAVYKYEQFVNPNNIYFAFYCALTPDPEIVFIAGDYENMGLNPVHSLIMKGYPQCPYIIDSYRSYMATHATANIASIIGQGASGIGGAVSSALNAVGNVSKAGEAIKAAEVAKAAGVAGATEGLTSTVASAAGSTVAAGAASIAAGAAISASIIDNAKQASQGNKPRGITGSNTLVGAKKYKPHLRRMCITAQYAAMIDSFFDMYGYATNLVKIPNRTRSGKTFCYTQTANCNVVGSIPAFDLAKIKNIYDSGITFWTSLSAVGDYPT